MATLLIPTDTSQATLGYLLADGTIPLTGDWDVGAFDIKHEDNKGSIYGTGDDSSITYNGTDLVIDPQLVGSGDVLIPKDNAALALGAGSGGDARIYYDGTNLFIDTKAIGSGGLDVSGNIAVGTSGGGGVPVDAGTLITAVTTDITDTTAIGAQVKITSTAVDNFAASVTGLQGVAKWNGTGTPVLDLSVIGLDFQAGQDSTATAVDNVTGIKLTLSTGSGSAATAAATGILLAKSFAVAPTTISGINIPDMGHASSTTLYGLRIQAQTDAGTLTLPISQEGLSGTGVASTREHNRLAADTFFGAVGTPLAVVHIDQTATDGAKPVLFLDQADVSEQGIQFSSSGSDIDINLFTVDVTGTPTLSWDESEDVFLSSKGLYIANGQGLVVGHTAQIDFGALPEFQVLGTATPDSSMGFAAFSSTASVAPDVRFLKSLGTTIGSNILVVDDNRLGRIRFQGADGNDFNTTAAELMVEVDGTASLNDIPGRFVFRTRTAGGSLSDKVTIDNAGVLSTVGEVKVGGDLNHDGSNIGFFGVAPGARAGAYTQTFSTANKTHETPTVSTDIALFTDPPSAAEMATLRTFVNALKADHADLAQLVNAIIDDLQAYGLMQ